MNIHSSEHLFLYIYLSLFLSLLLPSPWLLPTQDSCVLQSVLADSGIWALGYWVWGETAWRATCWGCAIPGHSFSGYGVCLGDHHTPRQHRAGEATKPSSLSAIGLPVCSNRPWRMLAPQRQGHEPGVLLPSDVIFSPFTVMLMPDRKKYTGNEFYLQSPRTQQEAPPLAYYVFYYSSQTFIHTERFFNNDLEHESEDSHPIFLSCLVMEFWRHHRPMFYWKCHMKTEITFFY